MVRADAELVAAARVAAARIAAAAAAAAAAPVRHVAAACQLMISFF